MFFWSVASMMRKFCGQNSLSMSSRSMRTQKPWYVQMSDVS